MPKNGSKKAGSGAKNKVSQHSSKGKGSSSAALIALVVVIIAVGGAIFLGGADDNPSSSSLDGSKSASAAAADFKHEKPSSVYLTYGEWPLCSAHSRLILHALDIQCQTSGRASASICGGIW